MRVREASLSMEGASSGVRICGVNRSDDQWNLLTRLSPDEIDDFVE
jgi:hypothetical protein